MPTQQAYIEGFVKRAADYGYSQQEALNILKQASPDPLPQPGRPSGVARNSTPLSEGQKYHLDPSQTWEKHLERRAYQAAKGMKETIHPPSSEIKGVLGKLKSLLRRK